VKLVTRRAWGAKEPRGFTQLSARAIDTLVFHYSAADSDEQSDHANCPGRVRGVQAFHMGPQRGWSDIAYNFLVCKHGYVFEGRGWGIRSAATGNANDHTLAVCFLGDDTKGRDDVTNAGRQGLVDIAHSFVVKYGQTRMKGHRDFMSTACPGDEIYGFVTSRRFRDMVDRADEPKLWPVPIPSWWWAWARWRLQGRKGPRPASAPARIPDWAWRRLRAFERARA
jgi:hypothetical protein